MNSPASTNLADVTLAVLAGGAGTRMGQPKVALRIGDEPILAYLIRTLAWPGPTLLVTAPAISHAPGSEHFDAHAVDPVDGNGPLQGVHTALRSAATTIIAVTTVDMPNVDRAMLSWLIGQLANNASAAALMCGRPALDDETDMSIEPFPSVWRKSALDLVAERLSSGRRSVQGLVGDGATAIAPPPTWPADKWLNLNYPHEYQAFVAAARRTR